MTARTTIPFIGRTPVRRLAAMALAVILVCRTGQARAECNIVNEQGGNCVDLVAHTQEKQGKLTIYRMRFKHHGGKGCPATITIDGVTGQRDEPGTIVSIRNPVSGFSCVDSLGCKGIRSWTCRAP